MQISQFIKTYIPKKNCACSLLCSLLFLSQLSRGTGIDNAVLCSMLETSPVTSSMPMRDHLISQGKIVEFHNAVLLLSLESGIQAVFKPCLDDTDVLNDSYAEVAAYKACTFMGFDFVPPTVIRTIDGHTGSLQLFVKTNIDPLANNAFKLALEQANPDDVANLKIFYFVFGQWDTGPHNILLKSDEISTKLIAIDNSGICNRQYVRYGELPFVRIVYHEDLNTSDDANQAFSFDAVQAIKNPTEQELNSRFKGCISPAQCKRWARRKILRYILYDNSIWLQFHAGDDSFEKSFTTHYPEATIERLKLLTLEVLKNDIFGHAPDSLLLDKNYLNAILERRDQILAHYASLHKFS